MTKKIERSFFTTQRLHCNKEKVLAWRDSAGFIFDVNPLAPPEYSPFHAYIESFNFGSLVSSVCDSVASSWRRSPLDAARNGVDHFLIQVYLKGYGTFGGDAEETRFNTGDIFILDASRVTRSHTTNFRNLTVWVPRNLLEPMTANPDSLHGRVVRQDLPLATVLRSYLLSLHDQASGLTTAEAEKMTQPTLELLLATLESTPDNRTEARSSINAATLVAVKRYINLLS